MDSNWLDEWWQEWPNEEEKEQFSPVSVLDCPFEDEDEDEDEEMCSPFQHRDTHMEGTSNSLLQNLFWASGWAW